MNGFLKKAAVAAFVVALGLTGSILHAATPEKAPAAAKGEVWAKRCEKDGKYCEVFQQLSIKQKTDKEAKRLIEFAVGYPADKKGQARGVFILPLGILLNPDSSVTIDGKAAFSFRVRSCDDNGCIAVLDLPDATIKQIKAGQKMTVKLAASNGQKIDIDMQLTGIAPMLDKIKG